MQEFIALLQLLEMLVTDPRTGVLMALLVAAAIIDWRTFRIPNWLTAGGILFALVCNTVMARHPLSGLLDASAGLLVGFGLLLPLHLMRVMGAGDVKLMAMVGAFLGVSGTLNAALYTFIVGGVAALAFGFFHRAFQQMLGNVRDVLHSMLVSATLGMKPDGRVGVQQSVGRLPYGVSICVGTIGFLLTRQLGFA